MNLVKVLAPVRSHEPLFCVKTRLGMSNTDYTVVTIKGRYTPVSYSVNSYTFKYSWPFHMSSFRHGFTVNPRTFERSTILRTATLDSALPTDGNFLLIYFMNLYRLKSLLTILHIEGYSIAFRKSPETFGFNAGIVNENVSMVLGLNETIALFIVEPFHSSLRHL